MANDTKNVVAADGYKIFSLEDWERWLDGFARKVFGMSGPEFESAYIAGNIGDSGSARDLASILPLLRRLRSNHG